MLSKDIEVVKFQLKTVCLLARAAIDSGGIEEVRQSENS
jgi:hypothetical protein